MTNTCFLNEIMGRWKIRRVVYDGARVRYSVCLLTMAHASPPAVNLDEVGADLASWHMGSAVSIRASKRNNPKKGVRRASPGPCIHLFSATLWFLSDMFLVVLPYFPSLCWIDEHSLICTCPPLVGFSHFKWRQPLVGFASIGCTSKYPNFLTVKCLQLLIIAICRKSYC